MINKQHVFIIGYTLEAAYRARELANEGKTVKFLCTGKLGWPLDDVRDYISYDDICSLKSLGANFEYDTLYNSTFMFIPYEQLKFINNRNGLISWPLNKASFDSAEEWEEMSFNATKIDEFNDKLDASSNYINIYKSFFPKWLYDSLIKHVGVSKWGGQRQSKISKDGLAREIRLTHLQRSDIGSVYRPTNGYESLCNELLNHENISIESVELKSVNKILTTRHKTIDIIMMDNRVDCVLDYIFGNFERVIWSSEKAIGNYIEEFIDIGDGVVFTPTKDYWCTVNHKGDIIRIKSQVVDMIPSIAISEILPTTANKKIYNEYKKIISLYSGKFLDLDKKFNTVVL